MVREWLHGLFLAGLLLGWFGSNTTAGDVERGNHNSASLAEPADARVRANERKALMAFYLALGGPDWLQRDFWGSDQPVGQWHGVATDAEGRVVRLTLYDNNLAGPLSPEVCQLERLHTLHLSFNRLAGALPHALSDCRKLRNLWVKGNRLSGHLPDAIAVLPEIEYIDVHGNELSGPLPANWNTPKLTIFRGEDNRISGPLPSTLLQQPQLKKLFLHNNALSGPIPEVLSGSLQSLLLANNRLSGPIPAAVGTLTHLTDLRLNRNPANRTGPRKPCARQVASGSAPGPQSPNRPNPRKPGRRPHDL